MVFPHGVGSVEVLPLLHRAGFLASCNFDDRDPLGAERPPDPDLGLRPADTAWGDLPLLWRRGLPDDRFVFDLFAGRPALTFAHRLDADLEPLASWARRVDEIGAGVQWRGLEEVALHAYLERRDPAGGWEVLMTANQICLHNPAPEPRSCLVRRPHVPAGSALRADGGVAAGGDRIGVVVRARGTLRVTVAPPSPPRMPVPAHPCSIFRRP
jgi:hypothetical protein